MSQRRGAVAAGATMILGLSACGGGSEEKAALGASTPGPAAARTVTARVDGRELSGHCRGEKRDAPAVVLESGIGANQGQLAGIEELLTPRTLVCAYDRAGVGRSDPPAKTPRPVSELVGRPRRVRDGGERARAVRAGRAVGRRHRRVRVRPDPSREGRRLRRDEPDAAARDVHAGGEEGRRPPRSTPTRRPSTAARTTRRISFEEPDARHPHFRRACPTRSCSTRTAIPISATVCSRP